ncbi:hypothetical protein [Saccharothrix sp.]|uniref:hypothetical protein n=1 Tax=Saccharothrix sp. TaxID=1873460 RepID=UPI00281190EC|nr:hypothetical protein [Saccharothrix sp.]
MNSIGTRPTAETLVWLEGLVRNLELDPVVDLGELVLDVLGQDAANQANNGALLELDLEQAGDEVHDAASRYGSDINNQGLRAQL